jgi:hypothetical protein
VIRIFLDTVSLDSGDVPHIAKGFPRRLAREILEMTRHLGKIEEMHYAFITALESDKPMQRKSYFRQYLVLFLLVQCLQVHNRKCQFHYGNRYHVFHTGFFPNELSCELAVLMWQLSNRRGAILQELELAFADVMRRTGKSLGLQKVSQKVGKKNSGRARPVDLGDAFALEDTKPSQRKSCNEETGVAGKYSPRRKGDDVIR